MSADEHDHAPGECACGCRAPSGCEPCGGPFTVRTDRPFTDDPHYVQYVEHIVAKAPPLTAQQLDALRRIFKNAPTTTPAKGRGRAAPGTSRGAS